MTTPVEAKDIIFSIFKDAWDAAGFYVVWSDLPNAKPPSARVWARVTIRHATGRQTTLGGGSPGARQYTSEGTVFVQVFAPVGDGSTACDEAATVALEAYRNARNPKVWFRDVKMNEVGTSGSDEQINVTATFSYDAR